MATAAGVTQAIFPEGGLSRDGKLRPPKFGLLSYMVAGFDPHGPRDVVFIPVGINYDRVLEDRMLTSVANAEPGEEAGVRLQRGDLRAPFLPPSLDGHARRVVSLRLYLRELRRAGVAAKICRAQGRSIFARSRRSRATPRSNGSATS